MHTAYNPHAPPKSRSPLLEAYQRRAGCIVLTFAPSSHHSGSKDEPILPARSSTGAAEPVTKRWPPLILFINYLRDCNEAYCNSRISITCSLGIVVCQSDQSRQRAECYSACQQEVAMRMSCTHLLVQMRKLGKKTRATSLSNGPSPASFPS